MSAPAPEPLLARTVAIEDPGPPLGALADPAGCLWQRGGDGLAAWGEAARLEVGRGPDRFERTAHELAGVLGSFEVRDEVGEPGTGPIAFGAFTFDEEAGGSVLVVPSVVVGRRGRRAWRTVVGPEPAHEPVVEPQPPDRIRYWGPSASEMSWLDAVARAEAAVRRGELEKVVLARDERVWTKTPIPRRRLLARLAQRFPECYTFSMDGLVGATPELLVRRTGDEIASLVLAGSAPRGFDDASDAVLGQELMASAKDAVEHEVSVRSVVEVLAELCDEVHAGEPGLLQLANVQHIATDVSARSAPQERSALELAGRLHPTAAICGLPRREAIDMIRELEGMDRARYSGPVGWVDARGDGEWGIALRCAELEESGARLFAGGGIVAGSVPEAELEETRVKLRAMESALQGG